MKIEKIALLRREKNEKRGETMFKGMSDRALECKICKEQSHDGTGMIHDGRESDRLVKRR
jgi:hypothetical protein